MIGVGLLLIVAAIALMTTLPVILGPIAIVLWWAAIAMFVTGGINIARALNGRAER